MAWLVLVVAGLLEVGWAAALPSTASFTRPLPTLLFVVLLAGSMWGLAHATNTIPLGTAYAVWVGIGAAGTTIVGIAVHDDPSTVARIGFLALLVVSIVGLKVAGS